MTPGVFINERSFVGQGKTPHDAACLMNELVSTIKRLNTHLGQSAVFYKAAQFMQLPLTKDLSMQGWIERGEAKNCDARNFLLRYLNRQPYFDCAHASDRLGIYILRCKDGERIDVSQSAISHAASQAGSLVSLKDAGVFSRDPVCVWFEDEAKPCKISNFTSEDQVAGLRLKYEANDKKHHPQSGGNRSVMDLKNEIAEEILQSSIPAAGKKQRYSFYCGKYYEFQPDNQGAFHGYRIEPDRIHVEIPLDVRDKLRRNLTS